MDVHIRVHLGVYDELDLRLREKLVDRARRWLGRNVDEVPEAGEAVPDDPRQRLGEGDSGIVFVGEKGIITAAGWSGMPRLLPLELHREYKRPPKTIPRVPGHHADWLRACKGGPAASSSFDYGSRLVEFVILGNVALRARKPIKWDGPGMKVTNAPEANAFLKEPYRKGWELP